MYPIMQRNTSAGDVGPSCCTEAEMLIGSFS